MDNFDTKCKCPQKQKNRCLKINLTILQQKPVYCLARYTRLNKQANKLVIFGKRLQLAGIISLRISTSIVKHASDIRFAKRHSSPLRKIAQVEPLSKITQKEKEVKKHGIT